MEVKNEFLIMVYHIVEIKSVLLHCTGIFVMTELSQRYMSMGLMKVLRYNSRMKVLCCCLCHLNCVYLRVFSVSENAFLFFTITYSKTYSHRKRICLFDVLVKIVLSYGMEI